MSTPEQNKVTIPLHKPHLKEKLFFFSSGIIISIPVASFFEAFASIISPALAQPYANILAFAIAAPLIEEFGKAYPLFYRHGETKKSVMNLGLLVGLGFGLIEFLEYVLFLGAPILVRIPGLFFHACNTSIVGYGIANKKSAWFYLLAVGLHSSYNLAALFEPTNLLILLIFLASLYLFYYLYQKTPETLIPY